MPIPDFGGLPPDPSFTDMVNKVNQLVQKFRNLLLNLDSLNVVELTADHITAGTINTEEITITAADGSKYYKIDGNGIVANNGSVNTLLFDLATGLMTLTSVLVQSATNYPKVELNSANNLIAAISAPGVYAGFLPAPGFGAVPSLVFVSGNTTKAFVQRGNVVGTTMGTFDGENLNFQASGSMTTQALGGNMTHKPTGNLNLDPSGSLQINNTSGVSGTFYVAPSSGAPATIPITFTKGIRTS